MASSPTVAEIHRAIDCLRRLTEAFQRRRQQLAQGVGLTEHQWSVLEEISTDHFMPSMFAKSRESSPAAVSKVIRQLVDRGLVHVSLSKSDGRQRDYVLTPKGRKTMATLRTSREQAIDQVWSELPAAEVQRFVAFGNQLTTRLDDYAHRSAEQ
jgi:DNA-binding MarR family transcriptional regulator